MNIQPTSGFLRQLMTLETHFELSQQAKKQSLINFEIFGEGYKNQIVQRINYRESLESQGFVYLGEKNWLLRYLANPTNTGFSRYDEWVKYNFENFLNLNFTLDSEISFNEDSDIWKAEINPAKY